MSYEDYAKKLKTLLLDPHEHRRLALHQGNGAGNGQRTQQVARVPQQPYALGYAKGAQATKGAGTMKKQPEPDQAIIVAEPPAEPQAPPAQLIAMSTLRPPEEVLAEAQRAAKALAAVLDGKKRKVTFNNEQYPEYEDWQVLGRFYGVTAEVGKNDVEYVDYGEGGRGFKAHANALHNGQVISGADALCLSTDEPNWSRKPMFQLCSMAQTRACAKALRNVLSWVIVLAGYKPTPAEEMTGGGQPARAPIPPPESIRERQARTQQAPPPEPEYDPEPPPADYELVEAPASDKMTPTHLKSIRATARECGWKTYDLAQLKARYHVEHDKDFLDADYNAIIAELQAGTN